MVTRQRLVLFAVLTFAGVLTPLNEADAGMFTVNFFKKNGAAITSAVTVTIVDSAGKQVYTGSLTSGQSAPCNGTTLPTDKSVTLTFTQSTVTSEIIGLLGNSTRTQVLNVTLDIP